jgi:hypothetical protein
VEQIGRDRDPPPRVKDAARPDLDESASRYVLHPRARTAYPLVEMPVTRFDPPGDDPRRAGQPHSGHGFKSVDQVSAMVGWDIAETKIIESNETFYTTILERLDQPADLVPAESVLGPLG